MRRVCVLMLGLLLCMAPAILHAHAYSEREEVRNFIRDMTARHGFEQRELAQIFARTERLQAVLTAIRPSSDARTRTWSEYRALFLSQARIDLGLEFWDAQRETLARAERAFGVPAAYIVAVIGVETFYGRRTGRWRVIDALTTLAFDYPPRRKFFLGELENYLLYARSAGIDVFSVKGSYAGAIGIPQFMPGSYLRYAIDFDGDGFADLRESPADAIGSVANFLKEHGWRRGGTVLLDVDVPRSGHEPYADGEMRPRHTLEALAKVGVAPRLETGAREVPADTLAVLIELPDAGRPSEFRLGFQNFYVLTRYNRSTVYAAAVHDLAQALSAARPVEDTLEVRK